MSTLRHSTMSNAPKMLSAGATVLADVRSSSDTCTSPAHFRPNAEPVGALVEVPVQSAAANVVERGPAVESAASHVERVAIDVRGEDGQVPCIGIPRQGIQEQHGNGVGLFASPAARAPDTYLLPAVPPSSIDDLGQDASAQQLEDERITKERAVVDLDGLEQRNALGPVVPDALRVGRGRVDLQLLETQRDLALHVIFRVPLEVDPEALPHEPLDLGRLGPAARAIDRTRMTMKRP